MTLGDGVKQAIGVVAFCLNVWGNLELTKQGNRGHIIRLTSNACWIVYSPLVGAWALLANHMTFAAINVLGYHRWKKIERERAPSPSDVTEHIASDREQLVRDRIDLLDEIVRCSAPALTWEKSALDACFPGLHNALSALKKAEDAK